VSVVGGNQLVLSDRTGAVAASTQLAAIPQNAWRCVELEAKLDGTLSVWIGKTLAAQVHSQQTALIAAARVGLAYAGTAGPKTSTLAYFDDVVIGTHAVGCLH